MAIYEFVCVECGNREELRLNWAKAQDQWCHCGGQLQMVPSRPASFPVGKYGKGGGCNS